MRDASFSIRRLSIAAALGLAALTSACAEPPPYRPGPPPGPGPGRPPPGPPPLAGTSWRAVEIAGAPVGPGPAPTMAFDRDGRVSGDTGCNRFTAGYSQGRHGLTFTQAATTYRACLGPGGQVESRFLTAFNGVTRGDVHRGRLVLSGRRGSIVLVRN
ncbi:MAG: META domain-containing protein [Caulobacter sp.]|nr:META domain-containing protein [Caulobacter sp.]